MWKIPPLKVCPRCGVRTETRATRCLCGHPYDDEASQLMKCHVCGKGMPEMATLHRINEVGVTGIWACSEHLTKEERQAVDPETLRLIQVIEGGAESAPRERAYLGDGVYAEVGDIGLCLTTRDGVRATNIVWLEPEVLRALVVFIRKHYPHAL